MRILVTGGAGFIGRHLVAALLARGDDVVVLDDLSSGDPTAIPDGVPLLEADIADAAVADMVAALQPDAVLHAAAQVRVPASVADPARDRAVNLEGTRHVLAGASAAGARRMVFLSSGGAVYGETDDAGASESTPPAPKSPYGEHKLAAERLVQASPVGSIARLANVYGPGQRSDQDGGVVAIFADALRQGQPLVIHGDGLQRRDLVHVEDVAGAILRMLDSPRLGTWNVATGRGTTILELVAALEARLGPAARIDHLPPRAGDVRASTLQVERIAADLGWRPELDLAAGLDRLLALDAVDRPGAPAGARRSAP